MEDKCKAKRRRRERALQLRAAIIADPASNKKASEDDSCDEALPIVRSKPPRPRKKNKEPLFEEDIIDGFAILAFKAYDDVEFQPH
ncbi:hypothetical protein HAZT_HAZT006035 [Hyalella azteca]|uniref:Uncharacterized protein n=1 Tax=Hyalella azteca TaxID=294128 RepID=A0A6A0HAJ5_HYAAZ|nr:hypothetical protein HAZT_HAZT006035 [Hyalella azteca]